MIDLGPPPDSSAHSYKIAPIGRRVRVQVSADKATLAAAASGRVLKELSLHGLSSGRWSAVAMVYAGQQALPSRALVLKGEGGSLTLRQGDGRPGARKGPNSTEFYAACAAVLSAAERLNPGLRLGLGPSRPLRLVVAALGALVALFGLLMLVGAAGSMISGEWLTAVILLAAAAGSGAAGLISLLSFNPFKPQETIAAADLAAELASLAASPPA